MRDCKLVDLMLTGNPICNRFRDQSAYIRYSFHVYIQSSGRSNLDFLFFNAYG